MKFGKILPLVVWSLPVLALGQGFRTLPNAFDSIIEILNVYIIPLIVGIAVIYFLWGVVKYVSNQGDEAARREARNMMIYGIIAIFVMVSVWGLVNVLGDTLKLDTVPADLPVIPQ